MAVVGLGIGSLIRAQVAAVIGALVWLLFVEQAARGDAPNLHKSAPGALPQPQRAPPVTASSPLPASPGTLPSPLPPGSPPPCAATSPDLGKK